MSHLVSPSRPMTAQTSCFTGSTQLLDHAPVKPCPYLHPVTRYTPCHLLVETATLCRCCACSFNSLLPSLDGLSRDTQHSTSAAVYCLAATGSPVRLPVQDVFKGRQGGTCVGGKLEAGALRPGGKLLVVPGYVTATVKGLEVNSQVCVHCYDGSWQVP